MKPHLTDEDYEKAAAELGCEVAAIQAVADVESAGNGFLDDDQPKILFEAHHFSRLTGHQYDTSHSSISSRYWNRSLYKGDKKEHDRLAEAAALNREAALQSASWGKFQVMGFNYASCGYGTLQGFINDMYESESGHLRAFVGFIKMNNNLLVALRARDWAKFALGYNGTGYAVNKYDQKMLSAYFRHSGTRLA